MLPVAIPILSSGLPNKEPEIFKPIVNALLMLSSFDESMTYHNVK